MYKHGLIKSVTKGHQKKEGVFIIAIFHSAQLHPVSPTIEGMLLHNHESSLIGGALHHLLEGLGLGEKTVEFLVHIAVDCTEVFFLLFAVMTAVYFLQTYLDIEGLRQKLTRLKSIWGYALAAVLGVLSPFCSCSIVPVLLGLVSMGVPLPVCLCMLTTASLMNLTALTSLYTLMGSAFFGVYLVCALVIVAGSSFLFSRFAMEDGLKEFQLGEHHHHHGENLTVAGRLQGALQNAWSIFCSSWAYIVAGVVLSSAIITFAPVEKLADVVNRHSMLSATIAALVGLPIHSDIFSILPVLRLMQSVCPTIAVTFCLSTMVVSVPGVVMLSRVMKPKTILRYTGTLVVLTMMVGYVLLLMPLHA